MFKLLLILVLVYLLFRAGRNLLRAAIQDGLMRAGEPGDGVQRRDDEKRSGRTHAGGQEIEDAVWEDLP